MGQVMNKNMDAVSLALSVLKEIPAGSDFEPGCRFYVRNNTESTVEVEILPAGNGDDETISVNVGGCTELPVLVKKVINAPAGLQWGY